MADITLCSGDNKTEVCPMREACYRFTAEPNPHRQAYFTEMPWNMEPNTFCGYYLDNRNR